MALFSYRLVFPLMTRAGLSAPLMLNVMDFDFKTSDDNFGSQQLDLSSLPFPPQSAYHCTMGTMQATPRLNLFSSDNGLAQASGYWPVFKKKTIVWKEIIMTAKVLLTIQVLSEEKAKAVPASNGNDEQCPLNQCPHLHFPQRESGNVRDVMIRELPHKVNLILEGF